MKRNAGQREVIPAAEVILIGGGHSHLEVVRRYGSLTSKPYRLTLINEAPNAAYAGSLSGYVAGFYNEQETFVDLGHLCHRSGVRFVKSRVNKVRPDHREITIDRSPLTLHYEALSIDLGKLPSPQEIPGLPADKILSTEPIAKFLQGLSRLDGLINQKDGEKHLVVTGADVPGIELLLAIAERYRDRGLTITIVVDRTDLLKSPHAKVNHTFSIWCQQAGIKVITGTKPATYQDGKLQLGGGQTLPCDMLYLGEAGRSPSLLQHCGLRLTAAGQMAVNDNLESSSHVGVYGAGDVAGIDSDMSVSKSGVYGRRMGRVLAENITRRFTGLAQLHYHPKRSPLTMFSYGRKTALCIWGNLAFSMPSLVRYKEKMDRKLMSRLQPSPQAARVPTFIESGNMAETPCCASGATLPPDLLSVIPRSRQHPSFRQVDRTSGETVLTVGEGAGASRIVQSVTYHRTFTRDLYYFGKVCATHCLTSIYAVGQKPLSAHVLATIKFGPKQAMTEDLSLLLDGISSVLDSDEVVMAGSHSQFGLEPGIGMMVQSVTPAGANLWMPEHAKVGDVIVLTKPLGSGILFAAHSRYHLSSRDFYQAMDQMAASHAEVIGLANQAGVTAATHFEGYGLAWHLAEMAKTSQVHIQVDLDAMPVYTGVFDALQHGIRASLHIQNRTTFDRSLQGLDKRQLAMAETLFDPQTSGGLVMAVAAGKAENLIAGMRERGLTEASIIGRCVAVDEGYPALRLKTY